MSLGRSFCWLLTSFSSARDDHGAAQLAVAFGAAAMESLAGPV
jgi:hypothetical protein